MDRPAMNRTRPTPRLSVVAPCYNEAENLDELFRRLRAACTQAVGDAFEIVLVNDGSRDRTWEEIRRLVDAHPQVCGVNLSRNHGHQLALSAGLSEARGERILIVDADLQDPPELLPEMMAMMDGGVDVVYGRRKRRHGREAPLRSAASWVFYRLLNALSDVHIPPDTGDFRLLNRRVLDHLLAMPEQHRFIRGMISWIGFRQEPIFYDRHDRFRGETKYTVGAMVRFAVDAITGFSIKPLQLVILIGLFVLLPGFVFLAFSLFFWFQGRIDAAGWMSLISTVFLLGSIQIFILGIMGEYVGRIFQQSKNRPLFIIQEVARADTPAAPRPAGEP